MIYLLKNGKNVIIRKPKIEDAEAIINVISVANTETPFLIRNPGEFKITLDEEKELIKNILLDNDIQWFVAEYDNKIVGQCSVKLAGKRERCRHRSEVAFIILKEFCGLGIGGKMMMECIKWCEEHDVEQIELGVIKGNNRAIKMYQNFGFEIIGFIENALKYQDGTYADEYLMMKKMNI